MKTKSVKGIYIKMLKFKTKQNERVNKMKRNKRFSKKIQIAEDMNGIIGKGNVAVALSWNGNSETSNKEAELNTFWFWEKIDWQAWVEEWKKAPTLDLCALGDKQEFWVEVVSNRKREWLYFKTDSTKVFLVEKLELPESFEDCSELKELTVKPLEKRGWKSAKLYEKEVMSFHEGFV